MFSRATRTRSGWVAAALPVLGRPTGRHQVQPTRLTNSHAALITWYEKRPSFSILMNSISTRRAPSLLTRAHQPCSWKR